MTRSKRRNSYKKELYYILCIVALLVVMLFSLLVDLVYGVIDPRVRVTK